MNVEYKNLTYILKVYECESITKAAEQLYISQPALSNYINKVEKELGAKIFDRTTKPISLTAAGQLYIQTAKEVMSLLSSLEDGIQKINTYQMGKISVGIPSTRGSYMLPHILPAFSEKYPGISVEVVEGNSQYLLKCLQEHLVDFIIVPTLGDFSQYQVYPIYTEELFLIVSPNHQLKNISRDCITSFKELSELPFILLKKGQGIRNAVDTLFEQYQVTPPVVLETTRNETAYRLATAGVGACIIPNMTFRYVKPLNKVERYSLGQTGIKWSIGAVANKGEYLTPPILEFIEIAQQAHSDFSE